MAASVGRDSTGVGEQLTAEPQRFGFFQAVRLLEFCARELAATGGEARQSVGYDHSPQTEIVRFRATPGLSFPSAQVTRLRKPSDPSPTAAQMTVSFFGLTGPSGVLPQHYTITMLERVRRGDTALREFLDLFNHRLLSLFYRAWLKYRLPLGFEKAALEPGTGADCFLTALLSLVGLGTPAVRRRLKIKDEAVAFYGGDFANRRRPAHELERVLSDYWKVPIQVLPFQGRWLHVGVSDRTQLGRGERLGQHRILGIDVLVGNRVWDIQTKFRVRVGPLTEAQFRTLLPTEQKLLALAQMVRLYAGPALDFDLQLVLFPKEVPWARLTKANSQTSRLGWDAWVRNRPYQRHVDDAIFSAKSALQTSTMTIACPLGRKPVASNNKQRTRQTNESSNGIEIL